MKGKKILSLVLALAMVLGTMGTVAFAEETVVDTSWYDESLNEYTLNDVADLLGFSKLATEQKISFRNKTVKLGSDIDLTGINWYESDSEGNVISDYIIKNFEGIFDGNNKKISNVSYVIDNADAEAYTSISIFYATKYGAFKNLTIDGINVQSKSATNFSGLILTANNTHGSSVLDYSFDNCHVKNVNVYIDSKDSEKLSRFSGLVNWNGRNGKNKDCSVTDVNATITGSVVYSGGYASIVAQQSEFYNCKVDNFNLNIGTVATGGGVGGFFGQTQSSSYVQRVFDNCDVTNLNMTIDNSESAIGGFGGTLGGMVNCDNCEVTGSITINNDIEMARAGGFVGDLGWQGDWSSDKIGHTFETSSADVDITAVNSDVGGFVGMSAIIDGTTLEQFQSFKASFNDCTSSGDVSTVNGSAGGFVGSGDRGYYDECDSTGSVSGDVAGGFWGEIFSKDAEPTAGNNPKENGIAIRGCDASDDVAGTTVTGGLVGYIDNSDATTKYVTEIDISNNAYTGEMANFAETAQVISVNGTYYDTLKKAIDAAKDGDTIDLLGSVIVPEETDIEKSITITNGTFDISGVVIKGDAIFNIGNYGVSGVNVTFDNVKFIGDGYNSAAGVLYPYDGCTLNVINSEFDLKNEQGGFGVIYANPTTETSAGGKINVTNVTGTFENAKRFIWFGDSVITDSELTFKNFGEGSDKVAVFEAAPVKLVGSTVIAEDCDIIFTDNSGNWEREIAFDVTVDSKVVGSNAIVLNNDGSILNVDATSSVEVEGIVGATGGEGEIVSKADAICVQFKDITEKDVEGKKVYELILAGKDAEDIHELASADLTFDFDVISTATKNGNISYAVEPAEGVSLTNIQGTDRYMFNYNGIDKYEESGLEIVIGTITVTGYGNYTLAIDGEVETNAVYATEIRNNIVDGFTPAADLIINDEAENTDNDKYYGYIDKGEIAVPTRTLTVNVTFPNAILDQAAAYQDMKVEINGTFDGESKTRTYKLGIGTDDNVVAMAGGKYVVTDEDLVLDNAYTVTVSGAGYRTARYTVTMTKDKVLTFWNNVMDDDTVVEEGVFSQKVNFLAGDIVKDSQINIYDLSAVVSYFGTEGLSATNHPEYAKYDLNRDGVIDSKDVAYVLVSWGK